MRSKVACLLLVSCLCFSVGVAKSQDDLTSATKSYEKYRRLVIEPKIGLKKVKMLIKSTKRDRDENLRISDGAWNGLTTQEKVSYCLLHCEDYAQMCDAMPPIPGSEKLIESFFPDAFDEASYSKRQVDFIEENEDAMLGTIRQLIKEKKRVGLNLKQALYQINSYKIVPDLLAAYQADSRDHDILTLLMILMKEGNFQAFKSSKIYEDFYGENANYRNSKKY